MEQNEENKPQVEPERDSGGCSCGCGGEKSSNIVVIAIWVVLLVGFACFAMYSRSNLNEEEKLLQTAGDLYENQQFEESAKYLLQAAELGHPLAQTYYGGCLKKGIGVPQDMAAAVEWYRKAADQNFAVAFYELAVCYENGEGVERNLDEALAWYQKALAGGIEEAQSAIIRVEKTKAVESSPEAEAVALYQKALEYFDRQDRDVECADLLRQSAELGYVWAQLFYGRFLTKGIGTALDPASAVEWFRKAADQDCPAAFYELGVCYENGEGVEKNLDEAEVWYRKAVNGGFEGGAERALDRIAKLKTETVEHGT